jgi:hypothetical protein
VVAARDVLRADAANVSHHVTAPAKEGVDVPPPPPTVGTRRAHAGAGRASGILAYRTARVLQLAARRGDGVKTARERAEEKRAEKLEQVREHVESGSLVIRQMTEEERRRYPPLRPQPKQQPQR